MLSSTSLAYFQRIGFHETPAATLEVLKKLCLQHPSSIGFENIDHLLGKPLDLALPVLERKLIHERRGGCCYEHNLLFGHVLRSMGFSVTNLAARVLWNVPEGMTWPRTHMLLKVVAEGADYIVDVGFGGQTLVAPLRFVAGIAQDTPLEPYRLMPAQNGAFLLEVKLKNEWETLYVFDLQEQLLADYEASSWFVSTHPKSYFRTSLFAARIKDGKRHTLLKNQLSIHYEGSSEKKLLENPQEIFKALESEFNIVPPQEPMLAEILECQIR